jgi:hypothetical protein
MVQHVLNSMTRCWHSCSRRRSKKCEFSCIIELNHTVTNKPRTNRGGRRLDVWLMLVRAHKAGSLNYAEYVTYARRPSCPIPSFTTHTRSCSSSVAHQSIKHPKFSHLTETETTSVSEDSAKALLSLSSMCHMKLTHSIDVTPAICQSSSSY